MAWESKTTISVWGAACARVVGALNMVRLYMSFGPRAINSAPISAKRHNEIQNPVQTTINVRLQPGISSRPSCTVWSVEGLVAFHRQLLAVRESEARDRAIKSLRAVAVSLCLPKLEQNLNRFPARTHHGCHYVQLSFFHSGWTFFRRAAFFLSFCSLRTQESLRYVWVSPDIGGACIARRKSLGPALFRTTKISSRNQTQK